MFLMLWEFVLIFLILFIEKKEQIKKIRKIEPIINKVLRL